MSDDESNHRNYLRLALVCANYCNRRYVTDLPIRSDPNRPNFRYLISRFQRSRVRCVHLLTWGDKITYLSLSRFRFVTSLGGYSGLLWCISENDRGLWRHFFYIFRFEGEEMQKWEIKLQIPIYFKHTSEI